VQVCFTDSPGIGRNGKALPHGRLILHYGMIATGDRAQRGNARGAIIEILDSLRGAPRPYEF